MPHKIVTEKGVYQVGVGCCGDTGCSLAPEDPDLACAYSDQCQAGKFEGYERAEHGDSVMLPVSHEELAVVVTILRLTGVHAYNDLADSLEARGTPSE